MGLSGGSLPNRPSTDPRSSPHASLLSSARVSSTGAAPASSRMLPPPPRSPPKMKPAGAPTNSTLTDDDIQSFLEPAHLSFSLQYGSYLDNDPPLAAPPLPSRGASDETPKLSEPSAASAPAPASAPAHAEAAADPKSAAAAPPKQCTAVAEGTGTGHAAGDADTSRAPVAAAN